MKENKISAKLYKYAEILKKAPERKIVLMEKPESDKFLEKQIFEADLYLSYIRSGDVVLDIGSGGGFPGIPLAIMKENAKFVLVDRKKRHTDFLKSVAYKLNLKNVVVVQSEAEKLVKALKGEKVDVVCARAVSRIKNILIWAYPVLKCGGKVVLGKGKNIETEIKDAASLDFSLIEKVKTNFGYIVVYRKNAK